MNRADELLDWLVKTWFWDSGHAASMSEAIDSARAYLSENQPAQNPDSVHFSVEHPDGSVTDYGLKPQINDAGQCESARTGENRLVDRPIGSATTEAPASPNKEK